MIAPVYPIKVFLSRLKPSSAGSTLTAPSLPVFKPSVVSIKEYELIESLHLNPFLIRFEYKLPDATKDGSITISSNLRADSSSP